MGDVRLRVDDPEDDDAETIDVSCAEEDPSVTRGSRTGLAPKEDDLTRWLLLPTPSACTCVDRTVVVVDRAGGMGFLLCCCSRSVVAVERVWGCCAASEMHRARGAGVCNGCVRGSDRSSAVRGSVSIAASTADEQLAACTREHAGEQRALPTLKHACGSSSPDAQWSGGSVAAVRNRVHDDR